jgi:hypothetical protein
MGKARHGGAIEMRVWSFAIFSLLAAANPSRAQELCQTYAGAKVIADDKQYLGLIASKYESESVFNKYGTYGTKYSANSIWNEYGHYGGTYSGFSPFNPYSTKPPQIVKNDKTLGRLTVNKSVKGGVSPYYLEKCALY